MKDEKGISIIIPAHNCARTLERAVHSINCHNKKDLEVIIVENGSTDSTFKIANELHQRNGNVIVATSKKGVSNARNKGLEIASKDKIAFLDADDYYENSAFNTIITHQNSDLTIYSYKSGNNTQRLFTTSRNYYGKELTSLIGKMLTYPTTFLTVWGKIFNAQIIKKNQLRFQNNLRLSEDSLFLIQYLSYCRNVYCYKDCIYNYSRNEESTVRKYSESTVDDYLLSLRVVHDFIFEQMSSVKDYYYKYGLMQLNLIGVHGIFDIHNPISFSKKLKLLRQTVENPILMECLEKTSIEDLNSVKFIAIIFIKLRMFLIAGQIFTLRSYLG